MPWRHDWSPPHLKPNTPPVYFALDRSEMPSILSDDDKETVRRTVPKAANKILGVAVARLYVAHPNSQRWTYTGLQGAVVLANDLIGNTFWIKMVDVSVRPAHDRKDATFVHVYVPTFPGFAADADLVLQSRSDMGPRDL